MATTRRGKIFYADAAKGYTIKVLIDVLAGSLSRTSIRLKNKGIFIKDADAKKHMLFYISLLREKFRSYRCTKEIIFSLNLKHLQKMVRNVKKKDSMILFIEKSRPDKLGISIRPEGGATRRSSRTETMYITIQKDSNDILEDFRLPEVHETDENETIKVYGHPMVIEAPDFQKIKKFSSIGKEVTVKMQRSNYISFYCDSGEIYSDELSFGEIHETLDSESEDEDSDSDYESDDTSADGESEEESATSGSEDEESEDESEAEESEDIPGLYQAEFFMSTFSLLVKLPGLCSQMEFYAPRVECYPLKIAMNAGFLGDIKIFIKDIHQIAFEESLPQNNAININNGRSRSKK
uniref:Proliferating cell nuclear antigen n=1 Tax=Marseillevirus LCMAC101 TaxID=2506602 RepID=A0A481YQS1_9VIRU|nr:MAG: proliferating cell nuclear antigen [Marseillevirus LCMAC101]